MKHFLNKLSTLSCTSIQFQLGLWKHQCSAIRNKLFFHRQIWGRKSAPSWSQVYPHKAIFFRNKNPLYLPNINFLQILLSKYAAFLPLVKTRVKCHIFRNKYNISIVSSIIISFFCESAICHTKTLLWCYNLHTKTPSLKFLDSYFENAKSK